LALDYPPSEKLDRHGYLSGEQLMGRYILVEVDDNATADRLRAQIDKVGEAKGMRIVGLFSKASTLCECSIRSERSVRGAKLGWWVCPQCRRPKNNSGQNLWNMLDDDYTPAKYRSLMIAVRWTRNKLTGRVDTVRSVPREQWK